jgi:RNase_H superfamily
MEDNDNKLRRSKRLEKRKKVDPIPKNKKALLQKEKSSIKKVTPELLPPKFKFKKKNRKKVQELFKKNQEPRRSSRLQSKNKKEDEETPRKKRKNEIPKIVSQTKTIIDEGVLFELESQSSKQKPPKNKKDDITDWTDWVSATQTKNYLLDDGFIDVLQYNSTNVIKANPNYAKDIGKTIGLAANGKGFIPSLMNSGNVFESKVFSLLKKELGEKNIVNIGGNHNPRSTQKYRETIEQIKKGVPLIFQGILRNYENKTHGIADILIRSDWINRFTDVNSLKQEEIHVSAANLKTKYHYVVIDIKYKSLPLRSDGIHLRNDANLKAYKSQLWIYNDALSKIQGYSPPYAFILGSKWKYTSKSIVFEGNSCFDRLGRIDYGNLDNIYISKTKDAVEWLKDVRENEYDLSKYPLPRDELYPNMCNRYDYPYHGIKKTFAENNNDLTLLWNVGPKQRRIANKKGVYKWNDPKCNPEILGVTGKKRARVLDRILEANHAEGKNIYPKYIENNFADWKNTEGRNLELFVDFETNCSIFNDLEDLPLNTGEALIFLIGAGYIHPETKEWVFEKFVVNEITESEESRICFDFVKFINNLALKFRIKNRIVLWHYSHAEVSSWKRFQERNSKSFDMQWVDLLQVFLKEPIGIKGALNYSLKTISKTFYHHGYIQTIWDIGDVGNGADAAVGAYKVDLECKKNKTSFADHDLTYEIVKYNEVDCRVLQEILFYLRENHIDPENEEIEEIDDSSSYEYNKQFRNKKRKISEEIEESEEYLN